MKAGILSVSLFNLSAVYCHNNCNVLRQSMFEGQRTSCTGVKNCSQIEPLFKGTIHSTLHSYYLCDQCRVPSTWPALKNSKCHRLKAPAFGAAGTSDLACQVCMLAKSRLDQHIGDKSGVGKLVPSHWGQAAALQPVLNGSLLIGVPICSDPRLHHHHLPHHNLFATIESFLEPS